MKFLQKALVKNFWSYAHFDPWKMQKLWSLVNMNNNLFQPSTAQGHCELFTSDVSELDFLKPSRAELDISKAKLAALFEQTEN